MTSVINVNISAIDYNSVIKDIFNWVGSLESRYVCVANVHMIMEAYDSPEFRQVINEADLVTPDGMPLVWMLRLKGVKDQTRVYGPTLMVHVLELATRSQIPVGFYGSEKSTIDMLVSRLNKHFPGLKVVYAFSPPFQPLDEQESAKIAGEIMASGARILFVGLGCPKQEKWMAEQKGKIRAVMLGVGAAFDFHAGTKPQAPAWMGPIGLEWFFRLLHEPRRLAKRYLFNNPRFVVLALADLLGILDHGKKEA